VTPLAAAANAPRLRDAAAARQEARRILAERRFHASHPPRPLRPLLDALGRLVAPVGRALSRLASHLPFASGVFWAALVLVVVVFSVVVARSLARRRDRRRLPRLLGSEKDPALAPEALEREAAAAERRGDLALALRLRFRAGVLRLQRTRAVPAAAVLTSRELSRRLHSGEFDRTAQIFDEVVYGGRPAEPADVALSRDDWQQVLRGVRAR
jgi:hypothetical protein